MSLMPLRSKRPFHERKQEVINRWMGIKGVTLAHKFSRFYMRPKLSFDERKRQRVLEETFNIVKNQTIRFEDSGLEAFNTVFNIALFFLIAERDISAVKIDALTHPDIWKRNLCVRVILLTLHELDMDKVSGQRLKQALDDIHATDEIKKEVFEALRAIRKIQKKATKIYGHIRDSAIAHRDPDALVQYRTIRNIDTHDVFRLAMDFYAQSKAFVNVVPKLMILSSTPEAVIKQYMKSNQSL